MPLADGNQPHLYRREPQREGSAVMLDEYAEKALNRPKQRAVNHHRLMALAVFADIFQLEAGGQGEVELHGGQLPETAEDIDDFYIDFRAVEGCFAGNDFVGDALAIESALEAAHGERPVFI